MSLKLPPIKGIIFDLDGTLVDSEADLAQAVNAARGQFGLAPLTPHEVGRHVGHGALNLVRNTLPLEDPKAFEKGFAFYMDYYQRHLLDNTQPHAGVRETLAHFKGLKLAVATNKPFVQSQAILKGLGLLDYFCELIGGDTLAEKKPSPLPVVTVMERQGLAASQVVMVGDSPADMRAGKGAGVWTAACLFGLTPVETLKAEGPDLLLNRMDDLVGLLS